MSWGATAFTPIVTRNEPPFGFAETITPPDFPTNPSEPYSATEALKADLNASFAKRNAAFSGTETFVSSCGNPFCSCGSRCRCGSGKLWKVMWVVIIAYVLYKFLKK